MAENISVIVAEVSKVVGEEPGGDLSIMLVAIHYNLTYLTMAENITVIITIILKVIGQKPGGRLC